MLHPLQVMSLRCSHGNSDGNHSNLWPRGFACTALSYSGLLVQKWQIIIPLWVLMQRGLGNHWTWRSLLRHPRLMTMGSQTLYLIPSMVILVDLSALVNLWRAISVGLCLRTLKSVPCGLFVTFKSGERTTILVVLNSPVQKVYYWEIVRANCLSGCRNMC